MKTSKDKVKIRASVPTGIMDLPSVDDWSDKSLLDAWVSSKDFNAKTK